jgi:hypothetical protein
MRSLLLAALLLPSAAAADPSAPLSPDALRRRYLSFRTQADRLNAEDFADRQAADIVRAVQLGCTQPCGEGSDNRRLYEAMLGVAAEKLALNAGQQTTARGVYMPGGNPVPRSPMFAADAAALTQLARTRVSADLGGRVRSSMDRTTALLGTTQDAGGLTPGGAGALPSFVGPDGRPRQPTSEELAAFAARGVRVPAHLAFADAGAISRLAPTSRSSLSEEMAQEMSGFFPEEPMRAGMRCVLLAAEERVRGGRFDGGSGPFGAMNAMTNDRGRVLLAAKDTMMDYRAGYGGGSTAGDNGFSEMCRRRGIRVRLDAAQLADLDHFFFGGHTGTIPVVGTAMCAGGVAVWDGVKPLFCNWRRPECQDSIAYNWKQLAAGFKGCAAGTSITKATLGTRRADL